MNSLAEAVAYVFKKSDLITTPKWYINDRP